MRRFMTEADEMLALNVALQNLLAALPRCEDCDKPATRIGSDGGERDAVCLCDSCRPELRLWEVETAQKALIDGMTEPEVRWAPALRQLRQLLEQPTDTAAEPASIADLAERLLRLEALFVDPAELAKLSHEKVRELARMPGGLAGADLQLGRLTKIEDRLSLLEQVVARSQPTRPILPNDDDPWSIIESLLAWHVATCRTYRVPDALDYSPVMNAARWVAKHRNGRGVTAALEPLLAEADEDPT